MIEVAIVEDNRTIRNGLKMLIDGTESYSCVAAYPDCHGLLKDIEKHVPEVLLMDIGLPGMSGIEGIRQVKKMFPLIAILVLTVHEENDLVFEALCAGACGYLVKRTPPARLLEAIREAYEGGAPMSSHIARKVVNYLQSRNEVSYTDSRAILTAREREVLSSLIDGNSYKAIANSLFISMETVRFHIHNIYKKLHVHSQSQLVAKAIKERLV